MSHLRSSLLAAALTLAACSDDPAELDPLPCQEPPVAGAPFGVRCGQMVDEAGRVRLLRGVNARIEGVFDVSFNDGRTALEPIPAFTAHDATDMRDFGFDSLRLPINWSGLEPTEGDLDPDYLDRVEQAVDLAAEAGLFVLIDFHQDAYSKEIGEDGAPLWAILPPPAELLEGPLDDLEERRLSQQVLDAFDTFFGTSADGAWLRERFVAMASHVAERFADHPAVLGFEIYNEPVTDDAGVARLNQAAYSALRQAAPDKLYLFEPPAVRNFLDSATIATEPLGEMTGYAPHVYTGVFTTTEDDHETITKDQLRRSNANARLEANGWQAPLVITEWGFGPDSPKADDYLRWQSELQEEYLASSFFWLWKEQSQGYWGCFDYDEPTDSFSPRQALRSSLARVRPAAVAGWPLSVAFDRSRGELSLQFHADPAVDASHLVSVAPALGEPSSVGCDGVEVPFSALGYGLIAVDCARGESGVHTLTVAVAPQ